MDASIADLFASLQSTIATKSTTRLSERNVVELVNKLKQLGILGDDLLYTMNGREYITTARLRAEIQAKLAKEGGRLPLVELPALLGVDLVHCERQARVLLESSSGAVLEVQGELMTQQYFDNLAKEVDEMLQESGMVSMADLAMQYGLGSELLTSAMGKRVGTLIHGRQEGGLLYTPAYLRSVKARLRGALRGAAAPLVLASLVKELNLEGPLVTGSVLHDLVTELVSEGAVRGTLKGGASSWLPTAHAEAQQAAVVAFFRQNGWVGYDTVAKLGISNAASFLKSSFPDGLALDSAFVSPSLLEQAEAAAEEAVASGSWVDLLPLLPSVLTRADVTLLMDKAPMLHGAPTTLEAAMGPGGVAGGAGGVTAPLVVLCGTCVVSGKVVEGLREAAAAKARLAADRAIRERKAGGAGAGAAATGGGTEGKKGATKGAQAAGAEDEEGDDDWGMGKKGKKGGKGGGKGGKGGGGPAPAGAKGAKTGAAAAAAAAGAKREAGLSLEQAETLVRAAHPDMEGAGEDDSGSAGGLVSALAELLMPACVLAYEDGLKAALTAGAEARKARKEAVGRSFEEAYRRLLLYSRGTELLQAAAAEAAAGGAGGKGAAAAAAAAEATHSSVLRHVAKTAGGECLELLFRWVRAEYLPEDEEADAQQPSAGTSTATVTAQPYLTASERSRVSKAAPPDVAASLASVSEALASATEAGALVGEVEAAAAAVGMRVKKVDKKQEAKESKAAVAEVQSRLASALERESDAAAALALVVPLLFIRATGRAIMLPGKAIGGVLAFLKQHHSQQLPEEEIKAVEAFHALVVEHLKGQSTPDGSAEPHSAAAQLAERLPAIKALSGAASAAAVEEAA